MYIFRQTAVTRQ